MPSLPGLQFDWASTSGKCPFVASKAGDPEVTAGCDSTGSYVVTENVAGNFWTSQQAVKQSSLVVAAQLQLLSGPAATAQYGVRCGIQDNNHAYAFTVKKSGRWAIIKEGDQPQILAKGDDASLQTGSVTLVGYCNPDHSLALEANGKLLGRATDTAGAPYTGTVAGVIVSLESGATASETVRVTALRIGVASMDGASTETYSVTSG
jgi:hypothetical protein